MVRGHGGKGHGEILSAAETESLRGEQQEAINALKEKESYGKGTAAEQMNEASLRRQIKNIEDQIQARQMPKVSGIEKDRMVKELEELKETLQIGLPTRDEMDKPSKNPGAVRKHLNWQAKNGKNVERWRYLQRVLHPDDPQSIEQLRREK
jgi:hypothetical protein